MSAESETQDAFAFFSPERVRRAIGAAGGGARKRWGQNFLIDRNHAVRIAELVLEHTSRPLLEVGPGLGALTHLIMEGGRDLLACEIDPVMCTLLRETLRGVAPYGMRDPVMPDAAARSGVRCLLHEGDARDLLPGEARLRDCCGNLPYYISTELLLGAVRGGTDAAVFLLQTEFAERATATNGLSSLTVFLAAFGESRIVHRVPATAFYPRPEVTSAVLAFRKHASGARCPVDVLERILRASFGMRRKMLRRAWRHSPLEQALFAAADRLGMRLDRRAEELDFEEFFALAREVQSLGAT